MDIKTFKPIDHKIKALIYGPSGSGKTSFAGTVPNAIFASAEGGLLSIAEKNPNFVEVKTLKDLTDLYSFLLHEDHGFEAVIIDSITEINEIIKLEIEKKLGRPMQIQDWGELSKKIRDLFRKFRDLPMNVIMIAQEQYITDEDKIKKIVPSMNGKAATEIAYFMDIVGYMNVENDGTRWLETSSNKKLLTKDRSKMVGNDAPLDFAEWLQRFSKIETGEQTVTASYAEPTRASKPTPKAGQTQQSSTPHLTALKKELMARGATDAESALVLLNGSLNTDFGNLNFTEKEASSLLIQLLQVKKETPKTSKAAEEMKSDDVKKETPKNEEKKETFGQYSDAEKVKKMISGLNSVHEVQGLMGEISATFENGDMTKSSFDELNDLCLDRMSKINEGLLAKPKRSTRKSK